MQTKLGVSFSSLIISQLFWNRAGTFLRGKCMPCFWYPREGQRTLPLLTDSQLPVAENNPYTKVAYLRVACSDPLQVPRWSKRNESYRRSSWHTEHLMHTSEWRSRAESLSALRVQETKSRDESGVSSLYPTEDKSETPNAKVKREGRKTFLQLANFINEAMGV